MFSPFEELEYLSDYLPAEGESVLITRTEGKLVCKPQSRDRLRDGIDEADLYGRLVQANERLANSFAWPMWSATMGLLGLAIVLHALLDLHWVYWFVTPALGVPVYYFCLRWGRDRQREVFFRDVLPMLRYELARRDLTYFELIAGVRQHVELRNLLDELVLWKPQNGRLRKDATLDRS